MTADSQPRKTHLQYRVPYADTDRMGVVYYANYLVYFERVRNEFLREVDLPYTTLEENGVMLPVIQVEADYKQPAAFDDLLDLYGWIASCSGAKVTFACEVYCAGRLLVSGSTVHAVVDKNTGKPLKVPAEMADFAN